LGVARFAADRRDGRHGAASQIGKDKETAMKDVRRIRRRNHRLISALFILGALTATALPAFGQKPRKKQSGGGAEKPQPPGVTLSDRFTPADGGRTVHDNLLNVTWLLDANVGARACKGVDSVGSSGGMNWKTAWACIAQLNSGKGLYGHTNWQMPATPKADTTCGASGPHGNSFGENCKNSSYGSLFYVAWARRYGETVALATGPAKGGFKDVQPTLYWYGNKTKMPDTSKKADNGYNSFSFSNGWQGANVDHHAMYVWPMIAGQADAGSPAAKATIWDRTGDPGVRGKTGISWLADANVAHDPQFLQAVKATGLSINADGSMDHKTADSLVALMRKYKYLGSGEWMLPVAASTNCQINGKTGTTGGYGCNVSGMGHLYYDVFKLAAGSSVDEPADVAQVKPFTNVQPSLYWACMAATPTPANTQPANLCSTTPTAAPGFAFSFDMGNGFTDTTLLPSDLYLMVYYPDPPTKKCATPAQCCVQAGGTMSGGKCT
jgi:hypothetical protein